MDFQNDGTGKATDCSGDDIENRMLSARARNIRTGRRGRKTLIRRIREKESRREAIRAKQR